MYNDTNEMARGLSPNKLIELNQILRDKFGFDLDEDHDKVSAKINLIVQRGHLENDNEFRLFSSRVDEIYADDSKEKEVETLENLMDDYEKNKAAYQVHLIFPSKRHFFSSAPENFLLYLPETYALMDERLQLLV